jgi:porphobilinogen synthase
MFPLTRLRRLRLKASLRELVQETRLSPSDFVFPIFTTHGTGQRQEIGSLPGVFRHSLDRLEPLLEKVTAAGIPAVLLFGLPKRKDALASEGYDPDGVTQQTVAAVKRLAPELTVITDVCLCGYTAAGHCGLVEGNEILNDASLEYIARIAVSHARAGADVVAPSGMIDGRVAAIREALDKEGLDNVAIMSYAVKYASSFYGPFREAAASAPQFADRRTYQMSPANSREALREAELDVLEGADIIMVKPALAYLDIVSQVRREWALPVAAYNVSGEYAMVKAAAQKGWIDERAIVLEILTSLKRAGADILISYHALDACRWLSEGT